MKHPLTDEMCEDLMQRTSKYPYTDDVIEDMRTAADWQLEQVTKWLKATKSTVKICPSVLAVQLEQAMRPQEDD